MCEFHFCMCKVCEEHLKVMLTVLSLLHFANIYMFLPFNYPWSLLVIIQLLLVPTNIIGIRGEPTVLEGNNLQLTCEASGTPLPSITWTKEEPGNQGSTSVVQEGKVLTITNINMTDAGNYTCTAYNGFGKLENQTVYVNVNCEYALKKTFTHVKHRCTFLILFSVFKCMLSVTCINVWLSTSILGSISSIFQKITVWWPSIVKWSPQKNFSWNPFPSPLKKIISLDD